ncbi:MAG: TM2 domain-containing protein [Cyclobacteriaceae bacterium]|nr:TM2 domain-containing protein [Cyclobacteriaceae bacterium]MCH8515238.1 TM2 domain-containing protein [Cyclobacteriaceae bacterium]
MKTQDNEIKQSTAVLLALFTGFVGGHRFYLGQKKIGYLFLGFSWTLIPLLSSLIEAVILYRMPQQVFKEKYREGNPNIGLTKDEAKKPS